MQGAPVEYLKWYYQANVWKRTHYRGVRTLKFPLDMWNYQELMFENNIHWVLETGTRHGGSALFFADWLDADEREGVVVSVDITHEALHPLASAHPKIRLLLGDSADFGTIRMIRQSIPESRSGRLLLILDSDHSASHVLRELNGLVPLLKRGDYLIVEDTIINGHPVRPEFGPGPLEAIEAYRLANPLMLARDDERATKFGCTFAHRGYFRITQ